ncbi:DUF4263 domain-containing protein [Sinorhizobium meliloti]|nr:DUF4263 domain-containing protein [Sinorhizobium meliloti]MDW9721659.1 DUF4263 domain-containing protein [Sinorhizobium meliloti]MDW9728200.1 DUF4263 domain-containing protein [Sinorhizobium meliloti]MDW9746744.1 DUF4263 domain-containing protein [Sinorhizobium meliloti]
MQKFTKTTSGIVLEYSPDLGTNGEWIRDELQKSKQVRLSSVFSFTPADLLNPPAPGQDLSHYEYRFTFGTLQGSYFKIAGRVLGIKNDLLICQDIPLRRQVFAAERNISIFGKLADLLNHTNPIVIGGTRRDAIPRSVFEEMLKKFPNTVELNHYAGARVHMILAHYLDGMKDARGRYESYLNRKSLIGGAVALDLDVLKKLEVEKYVLIRDLITDALMTKKNWSEDDWQKLMLSFLLLLFPKYIKVLENVTIHDYYTDPARKTDRYIDIAMVDANGNLDVIEIKKPFDDKILRKSTYRGNNVPTSELSGSIMQAEKYLFHLSKWGVKGEETLTNRYASELPPGLKIRISNPKSIIIVGRDEVGGAGMTQGQLLDFEIIKRKYANMMDIITYDDLLRRLNHTIAALGA